MFEIKFDQRDIAKLQRQYKYLGEGINKALAKGMTDTAFQSRAAVVAAMPRHIDRPTPWTRRSLFVFPAERNDLRAAVAFKWEFGRRGRHEIGMVDAPASMRAQVYGGKRALKGHEKRLLQAGITTRQAPFLIPTEHVKKDRYGNVTTATLNRVLYSGVSGGTASGTPLGGTKARRTRAAGRRYFIMRKGQRPIGIFERYRREIKPLFWFATQASYQSRFDFDSIAARGASKLESNIDSEIVKQIRKYIGR